MCNITYLNKNKLLLLKTNDYYKQQRTLFPLMCKTDRLGKLLTIFFINDNIQILLSSKLSASNCGMFSTMMSSTAIKTIGLNSAQNISCRSGSVWKAERLSDFILLSYRLPIASFIFSFMAGVTSTFGEPGWTRTNSLKPSGSCSCLSRLRIFSATL